MYETLIDWQQLHKSILHFQFKKTTNKEIKSYSSSSSSSLWEVSAYRYLLMSTGRTPFLCLGFGGSRSGCGSVSWSGSSNGFPGASVSVSSGLSNGFEESWSQKNSSSTGCLGTGWEGVPVSETEDTHNN